MPGTYEELPRNHLIFMWWSVFMLFNVFIANGQEIDEYDLCEEIRSWYNHTDTGEYDCTFLGRILNYWVIG